MREFQGELDSCYYKQLERKINGYDVGAPKYFLDRLYKVWCRMDISAI